MSHNITLTEPEITQLLTLIEELRGKYPDFNCKEFLKDSAILAHKMPARLVEFLNNFKYDPPEDGYCIIKGFPVDHDEIGLTPEHWDKKDNDDRTWRQCMFNSLCSAVLGDMFGWLTQQDGRIIHDVLPIQSHEHEQLGSGSKEELTWHTEDAFHELRGDYLAFMCIRNHDGVPTTVSRPDFSKLTMEQLEILFEPHYEIKPDNSHKAEYESKERAAQRQEEDCDTIKTAYAQVAQQAEKNDKIAVLFGKKEQPYMRIDPYFMQDAEMSKEAEEALDALIGLIDENLIDVSLKAGELAIFDNFKVVHGRRQFKARYDGTDRWFKRINITRDIRRSRHVRNVTNCRILY